MALKIWRESSPVIFTPAQTYLERRGLKGPYSENLRFHRGLRHSGDHRSVPALVALIERFGAKDGGFEPVGVSITYLTKDGRKAGLDPERRSYGPIKGGGVWFGDGNRKASPSCAQADQTDCGNG